MSEIVFIIIMFFVCFILHEVFLDCIKNKPGFKFFLFWLCVCVGISPIFTISAGIYAFLIYCFVIGAGADDTSYESSGSIKSSNSDNAYSNDKVYVDGTRRVENLSKTGYYYSNGMESWTGMFGEEHRSNGEIVRDNAYISGRRDIYDKNGKYVGYEYDSLGVTHRVRVDD